MAASTDTRSFGLDRYLPEDVRTILEERFWHAVEEKANEIEAFMARGSCDRDRFRFEASTEGTQEISQALWRTRTADPLLTMEVLYQLS